MIPRDVIEKIKEKLDIVDVISEYINLERVGQYYRALCPFHTETRPSFFVSPKLQRYKCFGCGASGDVIKFVQEIENISFYEALEKLSKRAGVDISKYSGYKGKSEFSKYVNFLEALKRAYKEELIKNKKILDYLEKERKLSSDDIEYFEIGYSPDDSSVLKRIVKELNLNWEFLVKTGVVAGNRNNLRDIFAGRVVFPIKGESGGTIAFGGRIIGDGEPKYLNSRDTRFFSKSRTLYLFDKAKNSIRDLDFVIITEGYFDAIAYHKCGFENTVAVLGTALTPYHASRLANLSKSAILAFDSDEAGKRAALRSLETLLARGFEILVVEYSGGKDADEIYKKFGKEGLEKVLEEAIPYEKFIVRFFASAYDLSSSAGIERFARDLSEWGKKIQKYSTSSRLKSFIEYAAEVSGLESKDIERFISAKRIVSLSSSSSHIGMEEILAFLFFNYEDLREEILTLEKEIIGDKMKEILTKYEETQDLNKTIESLSNETGDWVFSVLKDTPPPADPRKILEDAKRNLELKKLRKRVQEIDHALQKANGEEKKILLKARMELIRKIKTLHRG